MREGLKRANDRRAGSTTSRTWVLIAALIGVGLSLQLLTMGRFEPLEMSWTLPWWTIALGFAIAGTFVAHVAFRGDAHTISVMEIPLVLGLALATPGALIAGRLLGSGLALALHRRQSLIKLVFNLSLFYVETVAAIAVYRLVLGTSVQHGAAGWVAALVAMVVVQIIGLAAVTTVLVINNGPRSAVALRRTAVASFSLSMGAALVGVVGVAVAWHDMRNMVTVLLLGVALFALVDTYGRLRTRSDAQTALTGFTNTVSASLEHSEAVAKTLAHGREILRVATAKLIIDTGKGHGSFEQYTLLPDGSVESAELNRADMSGLVELLEDAGGGLNLNRPVDPKHTRAVEYFKARGFRDGLVAPIGPDGEALGVLVVGNRLSTRHRFGKYDLKLLGELASHASGALS